MSGPSCAGCGSTTSWSPRPFCAACWADVPLVERRRLDRAQTALARRPTAPDVVAAFDEALAAAASYCDAPTTGAGP